MSSSVGGHKRIAKNTLYMYIRLLVTMPVAFITSRLILNELGVSDYGIYNAVAGIVVLFSTLRGAFASATQRFYNVFIGQGEKTKLSETFTVSLLIHCAITVLLVCVIEVFGLWFINNEMNYPIERRGVTLFLFQMIVLSTSFQIMNIPFDALIIAYERMSFYSYVSVAESILKLGTAFLMIHFNGDKLLFYAISIPCVRILILVVSVIYCRNNFSNIKLVRLKDKLLAKELTKFAGWSMIGNVVYSFVNEGTNLLLNVFGGVLANTARGIALQVKNAIQQVLSNTFVSVRPQAIQLYARGEYSSFFNIIFTYSKIIYYLALLIVVPIYYYIDNILSLWLGQVPDYSVIFLKILLIHTLVRAFHEPLDVIYKASGRVKQYELLTITIRLLVFPLCWIFLKLSFPIYCVFVIQLFAEVILWLSLVVLAKYDGLSQCKYVTNVIIPISLVTLVSFGCSYLFQFTSITYLFKIVILIFITLGIIWMLGMSKYEKDLIFTFINNLRKR